MNDLRNMIIRHALEIVRDGGDPNPCEQGKFCVECCLSIAKGDCEEKAGDFPSLGTVFRDVMCGTFTVDSDGDAVLNELGKEVRRRFPNRCHSKDESIGILTEIGSDNV